MADKFSSQPTKGMLDEYPWDLSRTARVTDAARKVLGAWAYDEYDAPLLEPLALYAAKSGEELVREQSYRLTDRGEREMVLRPEMTPSLARMVAAVSKEKPRPFRWWSIPKCYRYERPQKGRLREFKQLNVDLMGDDSASSDLEMFEIVDELMRTMGVAQGSYEIRWNHRGAIGVLLAARGYSEDESRAFFRLADRVNKLSPEAFAEASVTALPDAAKRAFLGEFLALKNEGELFALLEMSPGSEKVLERLRSFQTMLAATGTTAALYHPQTVRGLDYYTGVVFEVYAKAGDIHRALFGGGRYDNLCGLFIDEPISGIGFGMGVHIVSLFLEENFPVAAAASTKETWLIHALGGPAEILHGRKVAAKLRAEGRRVEISHASGGLKNLIPKALSRGVSHLVLIGGDEVAKNAYTVKDLAKNEQTSVSLG